MRTTIFAAVAAAALLAVPAAGADTVTGGKTVLKPDVDTFEGFADMSTSVGATGAAEDTAKGVVFPISGGSSGQTGPISNIEHLGGLVFAQNIQGGEILKFSKFVIRIGASGKTKLFAKQGHSEIRFLDLEVSAANTDLDPGERLTIKGAEATLAKPAAQLMSAEFDFPFRKGIPIGTMNVKATLSD